MLTDDGSGGVEQRGLDGGNAWPILVKWIRLLLADRDERLKQQQQRPERQPER